MSAKALGWFIAVLAAIGLLGFGLSSRTDGGALAVGDPAPDKRLEGLGASGAGSLADYRGSWVLVNFWASWCEPCRDEAPSLEAFHLTHSGERFTVLGINLDDATSDALAFIDEFRLTYPQLREGDGRDRRDAYAMTGFPESFLVDPEGRLALIRRGPVDARYLAEEVAPLIGPGARK